MMGIDYTGAIQIKGSTNEKQVAYIILMTCGVTRAIHLEVVEDMTTAELIEALRRFSGHHPWPSIIYSDNATTFQSAANLLNKIFQDPALKNYLTDRQTIWKFITKRAPWHGGFWERLIGLTKTALRKMTGRTKLSVNDLRTIVAEIEAVLNDRPLTRVPTERSGIEALTPSHLLYGRRLTLIPYNLTTDEEKDDPSFGVTQSELSKKFIRRQNIQKCFWRQWRDQYLTALREQHQPFADNQQQLVQVGDVVLVHDDCNRINWKLAIVENVIRSKDGAIRTAEIRTAQGKTNRPVTKLYPLEVNTAVTDDNKDLEQTDDPDSGMTRPSRPTRDAAVAAQLRIREITEED
jgi:hypothetical protein